MTVLACISECTQRYLPGAGAEAWGQAWPGPRCQACSAAGGRRAPRCPGPAPGCRAGGVRWCAPAPPPPGCPWVLGCPASPHCRIGPTDQACQTSNNNSYGGKQTNKQTKTRRKVGVEVGRGVGGRGTETPLFKKLLLNTWIPSVTALQVC